LKLNLGCGSDKKQGFTNVDIRPEVKPDLVHNLENVPYPFKGDSIEEIIAKDVLEHVSYRKIEIVLKEWYRILQGGGKIYIQTPDMMALANRVILTKVYGWFDMSYWIYGAQDYPDNTHKTAFTIPELQKLLEQIGFKVDKIHGDSGTNLMCWAHK
jgi:predicted SAM-dependent methyltransferase